MPATASGRSKLMIALQTSLLVMLICAAFGMASGISRANEPATLPHEVKLVTLNWPPYTGGNLPDYGTTSHIVGIAFDKVSLDHSVEFYPWRRALLSTLRDHEFDGIYPVYHTEEREQQFLLSEPVGISPLGFIHLRSLQMDWRSYSDLSAYTVGYVIGYAYEPQLRSLLESKRLDSVGAPDDETLIRQLIAGHIEVAVMDHNVAHHILTTIDELSVAADLISYNPHLIAEHTLHVGFPPSAQGHALRHAFNEGLRQASCFEGDCRFPTPSDTLLPQVALPNAVNSQ